MPNRVFYELMDLVEVLEGVSAERFSTIAALENSARIIGMDFYIFAYSEINQLNSPKHVAITNAEDWLRCYDEENLRADDPIVKYVAAGNKKPVFWSDLQDRKKEISKSERYLFMRASAFGLKDGVSTPIQSNGLFAVLSFASSEKIKTEIKRQIASPMFALGDVIFRRFLSSSDSPSKDIKEELTEREIECLRWAADGKTAWEISAILCISERTVVFHLTNASKKLDASSRQHAVSKAILKGLIPPTF